MQAIELGNLFSERVPEGFLDSGRAYFQPAAVRVHMAGDALPDLFRIVPAGDAHVDVQQLLQVTVDLLEADPFRMPEIEEVHHLGQVVHLDLLVTEVGHDDLSGPGDLHLAELDRIAEDDF